MGNAANIEGRVKKLENLLKEETGVGTGTTGGETVIRYPVRQLTLKEEVSHDDAGVPTSTVAVTWKSPAGSMIPDKIKLVIGAETVELDGQTTTYRTGGYAAGDTVKVIAVAVYSTGNSSAVVAQLTLTGNGEAPETPEGFTAQGGFGTITLAWAIPDNPNHSHMEVWESVIYDNLESAERIAQAYGSEFVRSNVGVLETRWYWIRAVDTGGNKGAFVGPKSATTTAIQATDIPQNTIQESHLIGSLSQKINDSNAAIAVIEDVRSGDIAVFQQPSAPTEGMNVGDLWIDNNEAVWRYISGEWVKQENTTVYDLLKAAIVQYTVKTQVAVDGKLKIAGFGLFNDSSTGSEFAILADRFYIYGQSSDGTYSNVKVFTVDTTQSPPTVGINGNLIVDGTLNGSKIFAGSTIQLGTMVDGVLTSGQLVIGKGGIIQIGDGAIVISGANGSLTCTDPNNPQTGDKVMLSYGQLQFLRYVEGEGYLVYESIRAVKAGTCTSNEWTTLPGRWRAAPTILVGPNSVLSYSAANSESDQYWSFYVQSIEEVSGQPGVFRFLPIAALRIGGELVSVSSSDVTEFTPGTVTVYTNVVTTVANTTDITVSGGVICKGACWDSDEQRLYFNSYSYTVSLEYAPSGSDTYVTAQTTSPVTVIGYQLTEERAFLLSKLNLPAGVYKVRCKLSMSVVIDGGWIYETEEPVDMTDMYGEFRITSVVCENIAGTQLKHGKLNWLAVGA